MATLSRHYETRIIGALTAVILMLTLITAAFPAAIKTNAAATDYPAQLMRISIGDNSRNLNISGVTDKSPLNTWITNGDQNENWRFDLVGTNDTGSYFRIVDQGTGRLITPLDGSASDGTPAVIYGTDGSPAQQWYVIPVAQDKLGNDLYYKITNYSAPDLALTYNSSANTVTLSAYTGAEGQKWLLNTAGLQGFAGYCKTPSGDIKASATGGLFGKTVEVTTFDELKTAATSKEPIFNLFVLIVLLDKAFPTHIKHRAARCRELRTFADTCQLDSFILVRRSRCTNQPCGDQRENIFLTCRQRRKVSRSDTACGDNCMMPRNLSIVDDISNIGSM